MSRWNRILACLSASAMGLVLAAGSLAAPSAQLDETLKAVAAYQFGQSNQALDELETMVFESSKDPAARAAMAKALSGVLAGQATDDGKRFICRQLWIVGGDESVPALANLLANEKLSDMARYALERMPCPSAGAALRDALAKVKGPQLVGVINSVGQRHDTQASAALAKLVGDADQAVAVAAVRALGKIADQTAQAALTDARAKGEALGDAAVDSLLRCAEALAAEKKTDQAASIYESLSKDQPVQVRIAALRGMLAVRPAQGVTQVLEMLAGQDEKLAAMAGRFVRDIPGPAATQAFVAQLPKLSAGGQVLLLDALAGRGDVAALPAIVEAAGSAEDSVRLAALKALGEIGNASVVPVLVKLTTAGPNDAQKNQARDSLMLLKGLDVDAAIVAQMKGADEKVQVELIKVLTGRRAGGVEQTLLDAIAGSAPAVQAEAVRALGALSNEKALEPLAGVLARTQDDSVRDAAEKAITSIAARVADPGKTAPPVAGAAGRAQGPAKVALVRALGRIGGPDALAAVRAALKDADAAVAEAALRSLADWPDSAALSDVRELARSAKDPKSRILALRGFVRLAALCADASSQQRVEMYQEAMKLASRDEDRKMVLSAVGQAKDPAAIGLVEPCLDQPALAAEACAAAVSLAQSAIATDPAATKALLEKVIKTSQDDSVRQAAGRIISAADKFADFVVAWQVSGPYTRDGDLFDAAFAPEKGEKADWRTMPVGPGDRPWLLALDSLWPGENRVAYLRTAVFSPKEQDVVMEIGSDDGFKLWVNGKLVKAVNAVRACTPGQDKVQVKLAQGWNPLLMKVTQGGGEWQACLRIRGADGGKVQGLRVNPAGKAVSLRTSPSGPALAVRRGGAAVLFAAVDDADPIMGEYVGTLAAGQAKCDAVGRAYPQGKGEYKLAIFAKGDKPRRIELAGTLKEGAVDLAGRDGWTGKIADKKASACGQDQKFQGVLTERKSPTLGAKPPQGAIVLLAFEEGKSPSLEEWQNKGWTPQDDGSMEVGKGNNKTVKQFGDCQLHIEFRCPYEPAGRGQGRGNSGVYLQDRYEIQVLDSFGLDSKSDDCGGVYKVGVPKENACLPPGCWQTYDITFQAPRFDAEGKLTAKPRFVKVLHNGVLIQENVEIPGPTVAAGSRGHAPKGPIQLQDHGHKVRYRNIWIVEGK